jgi:hypothetical protein
MSLIGAGAWGLRGAGITVPLEIVRFAASDEERLLDAFRRFNAEQRDHVMQSAQLLAMPRTLQSLRTQFMAAGD